MAHGFEHIDALDGISAWRHRENGLTVLTLPTPVAPVVSFGVVYQVGSRHEGSGHTGATHMLEHLMFKGTERYNRDRGTEIARVLQRVGAAFNATTWLDRTSYFETLPVEHLALAIDIEADRMRGALVRDEDLASERTVVLNELARGENEPIELLMKASFAHAFLEHPYHHPTIGWRGDVEAMTGDVLRGFYDTFYHPDNAAAIVVGDIDAEAALALVERRFGGIPPAPEPLPLRSTVESRQRGERRFVVERAAELGALMLSWHIPRGLDADLPALSVLAQVLTEGVTSRLHQRLVETNRCLGVHAVAWELHDPGLFQVWATLAPGVDHAEVERAMLEEIERLRSDGADDDEVARARVQVRADLAFHRESPAQILAVLTEAVAMGDWRRFPRELDLVSGVSTGDLARVAATYLTPANRTVGWFVPEQGPVGARSAAAAAQPRPCFLHEPFAERVVLRDLPGGARLAVLTNPHAPTVTIGGSLGAGLACAPDGRYTVPGVTAAMLDRGTAHHDRMALAEELENHGLQLGVDASGRHPASISFHAHGLDEMLPRLSSLLIEVLRSPVFPAEELERLREQLLGSLARERQETFNSAFGALTRRLYPPGFPHFRRPVEVREAEVRTLTPDELGAFHAAYYGPRTLLIVVVGNVDADHVAGVFADLLEGWSGGRPEQRIAPATRVEPREELIAIADRPNLDVFLGHQGGLLFGAEDHAATVLANSCLGQSTLTSRLGVAVRDRAGLTYGIYSRFFGTVHVPGPWATFLSVEPDNLRRAEILVREVVGDYVEVGPEEAELADERSALAGAYRVGLATNSGVTRQLALALSAGLEVSYLDEYPQRLESVPRDEVVAAIRRHFRPAELVLTAAGSIPE
jgi:zinc protease